MRELHTETQAGDSKDKDHQRSWTMAFCQFPDKKWFTDYLQVISERICVAPMPIISIGFRICFTYISQDFWPFNPATGIDFRHIMSGLCSPLAMKSCNRFCSSIVTKQPWGRLDDSGSSAHLWSSKIRQISTPILPPSLEIWFRANCCSSGFAV